MSKEYNDTLKLAKKIYNNSHWPVYSPDVFYFYNQETANRITEAGKKTIMEINYE